MKFLKQVKAEMMQVIWPTRKTTTLFSILVIVISVFVAYYLGLFDYIFQQHGLSNLIN